MATTLALGPASVRAQGARAEGPTPPRLAFVDGEVSFWRPGADDWAPAQINTALAAGDSIYVGDGGNSEIELGAGAYVRAGSGTQLAVASLETGYLQLEVTSGHAAVDLAQVPQGQTIEVDSPSGAFTIDRPGYYRVDVDDDTTFTVRNGGGASVVPAGGAAQDIGPDQQVVLHGTDTATVSVHAAPAPDDWDRWNADRSGHHPAKPHGAAYVPPRVAGVADLDAAGDWDDTPDYGHVWVPRDVPPDWAPYSTGSWVYDPYYQWTWVDTAPWGWAPYHYGRWCRWHDRWAWAPGPLIAAPVYSPALVTFFGGGVSVSVGIGAPFVSWVALGWGEPVMPWWGPVGFHGHPYWGGWGGPRVVNNTVINNTTIVDARTINHFSNAGVQNAVIAAPRDRFGRGNVEHVRVAEAQARQLQPLRGSVGVQPVAASLVPKTGRAQAPPASVQARRVVATRPPQDPTPRLRAAGLQQHGQVQRPEARVVTPKHGAERREAAQPGAQPQGPPQEHGNRMVPPPPPGRGAEHGQAGNEAGPRGHAQRAVPPPADRGRVNAPNEPRGRNAERPERQSPQQHEAAPPAPERHERPAKGRNAEPVAPRERSMEQTAPRQARPERAAPPPHERVAPPEEPRGQGPERQPHQRQPQEQTAPPPHSERSVPRERAERPAAPRQHAERPQPAPRQQAERALERSVERQPAHERAPQPPPKQQQHGHANQKNVKQ
jgi:hypothetical protein